MLRGRKAISSDDVHWGPTKEADKAAVEETKYFSEFKKGEVDDLLMGMREAQQERDEDALRAVIQRVVAYMTLGIDVSPCFSEMIMVWRVLFVMNSCTLAGADLIVSLP